jgi:hypothetical protein
MNGSTHISPEDMTLYALQALEGEELAAVESHGAECAQCRDALAETNGDLALAALTVERQPLPEGARERFLARISAGAAGGSSSAAPKVIAIDASRLHRGLASRVSVWAPRAAVAALLIIAAGLSYEVMRLDERLRSETAREAKLAAAGERAQEVMDALTAPTAQRAVLTALKTSPAPTGRAVYLPGRGSLVFQANNMAALPEGKTYELWVIPANGSAPLPAGLFRPDAAGNASVILPELPKGVAAKAFGVTIEKAEGSATPTAPILMAGAAG